MALISMEFNEDATNKQARDIKFSRQTGSLGQLSRLKFTGNCVQMRVTLCRDGNLARDKANNFGWNQAEAKTTFDTMEDNGCAEKWRAN